VYGSPDMQSGSKSYTPFWQPIPSGLLASWMASAIQPSFLAICLACMSSARSPVRPSACCMPLCIINILRLSTFTWACWRALSSRSAFSETGRGRSSLTRIWHVRCVCVVIPSTGGAGHTCSQAVSFECGCVYLSASGVLAVSSARKWDVM